MGSFDPRFIRFTIAAAMLVAAALQPAPASAQGCFQHVRNLNYTPNDCTAIETIDRVFRLQTITWKNHDYLLVDEGNEIRIKNIDNPSNPVNVTVSSFGIPNVGDSDYDLQNFSVCDDCRWGIANFKAATVLFDLGTGAVPGFYGVHRNFDAHLVLGGFTFKVGTQQYLVAAGLGANNCQGGNASALYEFNGIDEGGNPVLQCVANGSTGAQIANGLSVADTNPPVIYMSERFDQFRIYRFRTSPSVGLDYLGTGGITRANMYRGYGVSVDDTAGLMAVADAGVLKIYDIGYGAGSPTSPSLISSTSMTLLPNANAVAFRHPLVHVAQQYSATGPFTFDVSDPANPVAIDQAFWDPSNAWNSLGACLWNNHAVFSPDGAALYLSRYSSLQVIDPIACYGPVQPIGHLSMSPQPAFPGDLLTVTNTSDYGDRYATWVTDGADPHTSTILAGSLSFTTGTTLGYTLPRNMASSAVFWAHAAAENDDFPYVPGSTPAQIESQQIAIDRTPQATISVTPAAVVTGDSVTLNAVAEGHPAAPAGGTTFAWTVTDPSASAAGYTGNPVAGVVLDESGDWDFDVVVRYEHDAPGQPGVPYQTTAQLTRSINSVSAAFTISPSAPVHNQVITLTSTSAAQAGAVVDFDWDVLSMTGTLIDELSFCDGVAPVDSVCDIPAATLVSGVYDFRLRLTNQGNSDQDTALIENVTIAHGDPPIDFTFAPTNPAIGQWVGFTITGSLAGDIEQVEWSFGGTGCDGSTSYTCVEPAFPGCEQAAFSYASSGTKTVSVTVTTTGGVPQPTVSHDLTVQSTGSCPGSATGLDWTPTNPEIGQLVAFTITGHTGDIRADWDFGEAGCPGYLQLQTCEPIFSDCHDFAFQFASGGDKTVSVTVKDPTSGATLGSTTETVSVLATGSCAGCTYAVSPTARSFGPEGGAGSFTVSTQAGCGWTASEAAPWLTITAGASGVGSGDVTYDVAVNTGAEREASITAGGRVHQVSQADAGSCAGEFMPDDGAPDNGYGWGTGNVFVQRFTPNVTPYVFTDVCAAFTQAGGDTTLGFDVVVFDDDGPGGGPGTLLAAVPSLVAGVPAWLDHTFAPVALDSAGVEVDDGSVFIGVGWDDTSELGFFVAADESTATAARTGFYSAGGGTWSAIPSAFPDYRSLLLRADGLSPADGEWRQVVGSIYGGGNGFGDPANLSVTAMAAHGGKLFVGTENRFGGEINYSADGETWLLAANPGFGGAGNEAIPTLIAFDGYLYAATSNPTGGCQVRRATAPWAWSLVAGGGFGDVANSSVASAAVFSDRLYMGTSNAAAGCEIWRSSDGLSWSQVHNNGFGSIQNQAAESMAVFRGELRVGTRSVAGAELWHSPDGVIWFSSMTGGFGSAANAAITDLVVYRGMLYAGVSNPVTGAQVWRSANGADWTQVVGNGFGSAGNSEFGGFAVGDLGLAASVSGPAGAGAVWQSADGVSWTAVSSPGFADPANSGIGALYYWGDRIWAGTSNPTAGCEVWRADRHPVFADGFSSGDVSSWSMTTP